MIDPKELRIGNLVNYHNDDTIFLVTTIDESGLGVHNPLEDTWIEHDQFSPIPITREWLERLGFEWSVYHQNYHFGDTAMMEFYDLTEAYPDGYQLCTFKAAQIIGNVTIRYIHHLQNLYHALTGKELEVK